MIKDLTERTRKILKLVVDAYVATGEPVGSLALSQKPGMKLSPATIRGVMAELEDRGLLYAPHTSAGRLPTETGLAVFVEGLLELDPLPQEDKRAIDRQINAARGQSVTDVLEQASTLLSGLSSCAGVVFAPKSEDAIKQLEFVLLSPGRVLAVIVATSGIVENRIISVPMDVTATTLSRASNYLNARVAEKTLAEAAEHVSQDMAGDRAQLDALTAKVVDAGIASLMPRGLGGHLFIKGQANLLDDVTAIGDLDRIRALLDALEAKEEILKLLQETGAADGVKIFIGAENKLFNYSGCAMVVAPYKIKSQGASEARVVGAVGVIGPARLNYGRVIPVVNYASLVMGKVMGQD